MEDMGWVTGTSDKVPNPRGGQAETWASDLGGWLQAV
jgi:hypothetical protein